MKAPLLWVATCFCAGIALASCLHNEVHTLLCCAVVLFLGSLFCFWKQKNRWSLICLLLLFALEGSVWAILRDLDFPPSHLRELLAEEKLDLGVACRLAGVIDRDPVKTPFGYLLRMEADSIENSKRCYPTGGGVRLALPFEESNLRAAECPVRFGDRVEALASLRRPKGFRNPGAFDFTAQMERDGIYLIGNVKSHRLLNRLERNRKKTWTGMIYRLRHRLEVEIERAFTRQGSLTAAGGALQAILLGNRYFLNRSLESDFQATGIYHVLVIAGLHVGIIAWFLLTVFRWVRLPHTLSVLVTLFLLFSYASMVEARAPIVRAVLMASVYLSASLFERDRSPLNAIGLAALAICLWQPPQIYDPGFQLSFTSVLSIAGIGSPLVARWVTPRLQALEGLDDRGRDPHLLVSQAALRVHLRFLVEEFSGHRFVRFIPSSWIQGLLCQGCRIAMRVAALLIFSVAIQVSFTLLMAVYFNRVSVSAPVLNLLAIPLMGIIVPLGLVELGLSFVSANAATLVAHGVSLSLDILIALSHFLAGVSWLNYRVVTPPLPLQLVFCVAIVLLAWGITCNIRKLAMASVLFAIAAFVGIVVWPFPARPFPPGFSVTALDVGQGDSLLLHFPEGQWMLVDGGGLAAAGFHEIPQENRLDIGEDVVLPFLWWERIRRLDRVVLTHAHNDHLSGLLAVVRNFSIGELWIGEVPEVPPVRELLDEARKRSIPIRRVRRGETYAIGAVKVDILSAGRGLTRIDDVNDSDSVVLNLHYGQTSLLLTGDIGAPMEPTLPLESSKQESVLLKVAHHGSKTGTGELMLEKLHPRFAIISVGSANPFGHPSSEVLDRLARHRVAVLQTSLDGVIQATSDGKQWAVAALVGRSTGVCAERRMDWNR